MPFLKLELELVHFIMLHCLVIQNGYIHFTTMGLIKGGGVHIWEAKIIICFSIFTSLSIFTCGSAAEW